MASQNETTSEQGTPGRSLVSVLPQGNGRFKQVALLDWSSSPKGGPSGRVVVSLVEEVKRTVRSLLPLRSEPGSYRVYDDLVADYHGSVEGLRAVEEEMRHFLDNLVEANTAYWSTGVVNSKVREAFFELYYGKILKWAKATVDGTFSLLSAELEGIVVEEAAKKLSQEVDRMVTEFAVGVNQALARMKKSEIIGRTKWPVPTACNALYYEDRVLHEHRGEKALDGAPRDVEYYYEQMVHRLRAGRRNASKDRHVLSHVKRVRVLGEATEYTLDDFALTIPGNVQQLLGSVPPWLKGLVRIVEGKSRTDVLIGQDVSVEVTSVQTLGEPWNEWFGPCRCSLVTMCDDILTGWGMPEENAEIARRNYGWFYLLAVALAALAAVTMGLGGKAGSVWGYAAALIGTLGVGLYIEARREQAIARYETLSLGQLVSAGFNWLVFSAGLMATAVGAVAPNWIMGAFGIFLAVVGAVGAWRALERRI